MRKSIQPVFILLLAMLFVSISGYGANADVIYVDLHAPAGGDGTSWAKAFREIQTAVDHASPFWMECMAPEDQIWVKKGIYYIDREIVVDRAVTILGGFDGTETRASQRDWQVNRSMIDGNQKTRCLNIKHFCVVDGLTIRFGDSEFGAGIYIDSKPVDCKFLGRLTPRIRNCRITHNSAKSGAGVYDNESHAEFTNCMVDNNTATDDGGGMFLYKSSSTVTESSFKLNYANIGGGISGWDASPYVSDCLFRGNVAEDCGGGMNNSGGYPEILNSTFLENEARSMSVYIMTGGGGINNAYAHPHIVNCIFNGNTAGKYGGGVLNFTSFEDSAVTSCTFYNNEAGISGGGLGTGFSEKFPLMVTNSIFWENSDEQIYNMSMLSPVVTYCDVQGGYGVPADHNIDKDPIFVSPAAGDLHLSAKSPCIDAGDNYAPALHGYDFEGDDRIIDDPATPDTGNGKGPITDIGADEYVPGKGKIPFFPFGKYGLKDEAP